MLLLFACVSRDPAPGEVDSPAPTEETGGLETLPGGEDAPVDPGAALFREDIVHELTIGLDDASWAALLADGDAWVPASFTWGSSTWDIGVRIKGNGSFRPLTDKPSFKVDFNREVAGQRVDGLKGVDLHNEIYDAAAISEFVAYRLYRAAGQPQSRTGFVHLTINDLDYGFYTAVEQKDDLFVARWWPDDADGSLYESSSENWPCDFDDEGEPRCDCFTMDEMGTGDTRDDLVAACELATLTADEDWYSAVQAGFDWAEVRREIAIEALIANWDTYAAARGNFYTYHPPASGGWAIIATSLNQSFGTPAGEADCGAYHYAPYVFDNAELASRCWADADCADELYAEMWVQVDTLAASDLPAAVRAAGALVDPYLVSDPKREYSDEDTRATIECIAAWLEARPDTFGAELPPR